MAYSANTPGSSVSQSAVDFFSLFIDECSSGKPSEKDSDSENEEASHDKDKASVKEQANAFSKASPKEQADTFSPATAKEASKDLKDADDYMRRALKEVAGRTAEKKKESKYIGYSEYIGSTLEDLVGRSDEKTTESKYSGYSAYIGSSFPDLGGGLQVCPDFKRFGKCVSGMRCTFVHDGAFSKPSGQAEFDPEDYVRRALTATDGTASSSASAAAPGLPLQITWL